MHAKIIVSLQEAKQALLDEQLANPKKRFNAAERHMIKVAKQTDEMEGHMPTVERRMPETSCSYSFVYTADARCSCDCAETIP